MVHLSELGKKKKQHVVVGTVNPEQVVQTDSADLLHT